jgi:hypothetical protein
MEFISLKTALAEFYNNTINKDEVNEDNILQWAADCLEKIGSYRQFVPNIAVLNIQNYKTKLPKDFIAADLLLYQESEDCEKTTLAISEIVSPMLESNCKVVCPTCCNRGIVETDAEPYLSQNFPWAGYHRVVHTSNAFSSHGLQVLRPMKLNDKSALKYHIGLPPADNMSLAVDYSIKDGYIICTERTGNVILFYLGQKIDEEGYPMIPNNIEYIEAINYYIMFKIAWADYVAEKTQQARLFFSDAKNLSDQAIARCITIMNTPTWEEFKAISEMWRSKIPQVNLYGPNISYEKARNLMLNARR